MSKMKLLRSFILPITATILIPWALLKLWPDSHFEAGAWVKFPAIILFLCGIFMLVWTVWLFYEIGKGTLAPWDPPSRLVTTGPYRYWRNPMISGVLLILGGEALFFNHLPLAIWTLFFLILNQVWFVLYEEPDLEKRFGEEYREYKNKTKRWLIN